MGHLPRAVAVAVLACGAAASAAEGVRDLPPLSVRGVNYFPRETPWGGMWTKTPPDVWERDMALASSLGANTIRTFLPFGPAQEEAGLARKDGAPTPAYTEKIESLLAAAARHGIRVIACFEFAPAWLAERGPDARWRRATTELVGAHRDDERVAMWDLMNEPDDDAKWNEGTRAYLVDGLPLVRQLDPRHLSTVGLAWRADRLRETGLPDAMQYHEYAPKAELFKTGAARVCETIGHLRRAGGARPLLIGEFGMSTARDPEHGAAEELRGRIGPAAGTEAEQARLYEIVLAAAEQAKVAGAMAWCLHDYPVRNPDEAHFGLVRADGSLKPAALVLKHMYERWKAEGDGLWQNH